MVSLSKRRQKSITKKKIITRKSYPASLFKLDGTEGRSGRRVYPKAQRKVQDTVFNALFSQPEYLRDLANELVGPLNSEAKIEDDTITNVLASNGLFNDLSFLVEENGQIRFIVLVEAQSTWNPSLPLRMSLYFDEAFKKFCDRNDTPLNRMTGKMIPKIRFFVLYTGEDKDLPETFSLKEDFLMDPESSLDAVVTVLTVKNARGILKEYAKFCEIYNRNKTLEKYTPIEAIRATIEECIAKNILREFLTKHRAEVFTIMQTVFNQETQLQKEINYLLKKQKEKDEADKVEAIKKAEAEAIKKAEAEAKISYAKSLIQLGKLSLQDIATTLELSISQVESLANEISA